MLKNCPVRVVMVNGQNFGVKISCLNGGVRAGKKACVWQRRDACRDGLPNSCACVGSHGRMRPRVCLAANGPAV